ncbi:sulfatase-like hydrolase/transferase [Vibrio sp. FNV 38]|nr:sulfatase-like hydrolase/transferase [Vibrio sp. FNV 38]
MICSERKINTAVKSALSIAGASLLLSTTPAVVMAAEVVEKPNVVVIFVDDLGWGDPGFLGATDLRTPNMDKIAAKGVNFKQGYVTSSICGPSRAGLLTGVYQQRLGNAENIPENHYPTEIGNRAGVPLSQPMLSEILKEQGYRTGAIGKWHLGLAEEKRPNARGFDYFYGFLNGSHSYYQSGMEFGNNHDYWPIFRNTEMVEFEGYTTEVFSEEAVNFITSTPEEDPFFLYLAYNAVHYPWEVPDSYVERLDHIEEENRRKFGGMVLALDDGIGTIVDALEEQGQLENTAIFVISDNGSPRPSEANLERDANLSSTGGLRGYKGENYEGGIRVPYIMSWPGVVPENVTYDEPVSALDVAKTVTSHLGIENPSKGFPFDGVDLVPFVNGEREGERPHDVMYWRRANDYAIRAGDWKLAYNTYERDGEPELFNLETDMFERNDLSKRYPKKKLELQRMFDQWDHELPQSISWPDVPSNRNHKFNQ